ncbi:aminopeptidase N [Camponotus floridanus]|uniref:aminopeptidase N n=1 Tax=Camponotus floridanus TaxID=104421 RepID=UPI000DC69A4F|nr:aminopeptidase N [Camponotus floridanus]
MIFLKLLFNTILLYNILICMSTTAFFLKENSKNDTDFTNTYRLPKHIIPYHYNIQMLWPDDQPEITNFLGECRVYIKINHPIRRISLHAQKPQINITSAFLKKNANMIEKEIQYIPQNETKYNDKSHILNFYFAEEIPNGDYTFVMMFISFLNNDNESIFKLSSLNSTGSDIWLYATHFQTIGARQIFPCWDEPELKATFNISIRYRKEYIILWNMNYETETDFNNITMQWMHINIPFKISTYHVAFCLLKDKWFTFTISLQYNLDGASINSSKRIVWSRDSSQISFAQNVIGQISRSFKNDFENWEKISITQHVFMPGLRHNAIEKLGLVLYRETDVIYDEELDSLAHKIEVACLIARQVAYQWFGITVSPSWWSYHWLNQGIATLLGINALQKNFAEFRTSDLFVVQTQQESLRVDRFSTIITPLTAKNNKKPFEINSLFSFSYYTKAPSILRMLRYVLTDKIFKEGIEKFYKEHMFRSATFDDFCNDMQIVYEERKQSHMESFIIKDMMTAWISYIHYPSLNVETDKDCKTDKNTPPFLKIQLENHYIQLSHEWWIPITITKQTELNFTISANQHNIEWMKVSFSNYKPYFLNFSVKENEWYIINIQQMGYYRVNYKPKNWKNIGDIEFIEYPNIHVLNRAQIIDDAYHFAMVDELNFSIFLELTEYLSRETDYVAWYPMFKILEDMSRIFPFPDKIFIFKNKILNSLNRLLQNIDYDKKPNEKFDDLSDCLRQEASKWACILGAPNCMKTAETKLHQHLINPEINKLLPWWKHWTFCNGLMIANDSVWYKVWIIHQNNPTSITSKFLACSDNSAIIIKYIEMLFIDFITKMRDNFLNDILYIIVKHANNNRTLNNILKNLEKIPREYIPK